MLLALSQNDSSELLSNNLFTNTSYNLIAKEYVSKSRKPAISQFEDVECDELSQPKLRKIQIDFNVLKVKGI